MGERQYSAGTRAALFAFCGGTCYWPGCREPVLSFVDNEYVVALQICHIRGLKPTSARYDPGMTDEQRNAFSNLIFLCHPHHVVVDRTQVKKFPVETLQEWKRERESGAQANLRGLRNVTEATLQKFISDIFAGQNERMNDTLSRLEKNDVEAAILLRELREEIRILRASAPRVDLDAAYMLSRASHRLRNLGDTAPALSRAAEQLRGFEEIVSRFESVAQKITKLGGNT